MEIKTVPVNLNPYLGQRFYFKKFSLDASGGVDLAYMYSSQITTDISTGNGITNISVNQYRELLDIRPRIQISANYKKFGVYAGYSFGIKNYVNSPLINYSDGAFTRQIRFGISYKIK